MFPHGFQKKVKPEKIAYQSELEEDNDGQPDLGETPVRSPQSTSFLEEEPGRKFYGLSQDFAVDLYNFFLFNKFFEKKKPHEPGRRAPDDNAQSTPPPPDAIQVNKHREANELGDLIDYPSPTTKNDGASAKDATNSPGANTDAAAEPKKADLGNATDPPADAKERVKCYPGTIVLHFGLECKDARWEKDKVVADREKAWMDHVQDSLWFL